MELEGVVMKVVFRYFNTSPTTVTIHRRESQDGSCTLVRLSFWIHTHKSLVLEYTVIMAKKELAFNVQILAFQGTKLCRSISYGLMSPYLAKYRKCILVLIDTPVEPEISQLTLSFIYKVQLLRFKKILFHEFIFWKDKNSLFLSYQKWNEAKCDCVSAYFMCFYKRELGLRSPLISIRTFKFSLSLTKHCFTNTGSVGAKHGIWLRHRPIIRPRSSKKYMYTHYITESC